MDQGPVDAGPSHDSEYDDLSSRPYPLDEAPVKNAVHSRYPGSSMRDSDVSEEWNSNNDNDWQPDSHGSPTDVAEAATMQDEGETLTLDSEQDSLGSGKFEAAKPEHDGSTTLERGAHRMHKFTLYETNARYWITGADITDKQYKMLKIDRTTPPSQAGLIEDDIVYSRNEVKQLLKTIDEGNRATGGLRVKCSFWGLLGFIRFTEAYYMLIITKRQHVAVLGGHYVYQVDGTELIPLTAGSSSRFARDRNPEESRFLSILSQLDLTRSFYFSYSYDITRTLQHNIIRQRHAINNALPLPSHDHNDMFVWNYHLLKPAVKALKQPFDWCLPIVHGFIDQSALNVFGRSVYITIIGRRSRFFAGARFLKRGANDLGYVANDVETEQIISEMLTTSFHAPGPRMFSNPTYTSYVHHRGSIPLYWTQDNSGVTPKPDIDINLNDPFYQPAALHFDDLFKRYGSPVYVLNLIKARERTPRESKLLHGFYNAIEYLNQFLPHDKKILYKAFDMSRISKTRGGDVIGSLEIIAEDIVGKTGFFHNGDGDYDEPQVQNGIARTNCVDCLDRTNAAQFVIGKRAFGRQLRALGVIDRNEVDYDTDAVNIFTHMFHDHGDTIAVQYGGSHLVNTMATYRKINHWQSHSRDMVESFKRYYHNSFLDSQRQEAYNLFLGNYIWAQGQPMLWDLSTDFYLHHSDPRAWLQRSRRSYIHWFTPEYLEPITMPQTNAKIRDIPPETGVDAFDDYWVEYYRPLAISSFLKVYSYRMNSTNRYLPDRPNRDTHSKFDSSPFKPRLDLHKLAPESPEKKPPRKGVKIMDPQSETDRPHAPTNSDLRPLTTEGKPSILREAKSEKGHLPPEVVMDKAFRPADKSLITQWTLDQFHSNSLNPSVTRQEADEYDRYISHPLNLPLVVSSELPSDTNIDYMEYVHKAGGTEDFDNVYGEEAFGSGIREEDLADYADFLIERTDPLTVTEEDGGKKRYKAYQQWLRGKSLFKQSKVDPEYRPGA